MKKILYSLLIISTLIGCTINTSYKKIQGIVNADFETISALMEEDVSFLLYIGRDDCGDCIEFYPILEEYLDNHENLGVYYLNIREIRDNARKDDASEEEKQFFEDIYNLFEIEWTPTIEWVRNGKIYKKYQFLDENYIKIKDRQVQKQRRQEFLDKFEEFMLNYEEVCYEEMS